MLRLVFCLILSGCASTEVRPEPKPASPPPEKPAPPAPPSGPDTWKLPDGCLLNLRGDWRDADDRPFVIEDDGESVRIRRADAEGSAEGVWLRRTDDGFVGYVLGQVRAASGRLCPVQFRARVTACTPTSLELEVERAVLVDEACRRLPGPDEFEWFRLYRRES